MTDRHSQQVVQKLWNYFNILGDDGLSYSDYASAWLRTSSEQLTFLLFLKLADEQSRAPFNKPSPISKGVGWQSLMRLHELETHYRHVLESLGKANGMRGSTADQLGKRCGREQNALIRSDAR
jgi:type I restriction enzyme M protein